MPHRPRTYSPQTRAALELLGKQIRLVRKARRMAEKDLAARVGIARSTLQRIEKGDPLVEIGLTLEAATLVGVPLFAPDPAEVTAARERTDDKMALLPRSIRRPRGALDDDF